MARRVKLYSTTEKEDNDTFFKEVAEGLSKPFNSKTIPAKYSYGGEGTELWF